MRQPGLGRIRLAQMRTIFDPQLCAKACDVEGMTTKTTLQIGDEVEIGLAYTAWVGPTPDKYTGRRGVVEEIGGNGDVLVDFGATGVWVIHTRCTEPVQVGGRYRVAIAYDGS